MYTCIDSIVSAGYTIYILRVSELKRKTASVIEIANCFEVKAVRYSMALYV